jgi:hypothetical protein
MTSVVRPEAITRPENFSRGPGGAADSRRHADFSARILEERGTGFLTIEASA